MVNISAKLAILWLLVNSVFGCANHEAGTHYRNTAQEVVRHYRTYARKKLQPYFKRAQITYPPKQVAFLVFKRSRKMQLWAKQAGSWYFIHGFHILASSGGPGPKLHRGDRQIPEGIYRIVEFNPNSHFELSMMLNYPNSFDKVHALIDGRTNLGNNIFIHGSHYSMGCIPVGNMVIKELFVLSYMVGLNNIKVIIAPDDLRHKAPVYGTVHPRWLPELYHNIRQALEPYRK